MAVQTKTECLITLENINKSYQQPNGQRITILENISLELRPGEIVALLGPLGWGKSTLMRIIAGLIAPTLGQIIYHNHPLVGLNPGVAIVFQSLALYPWLTVHYRDRKSPQFQTIIDRVYQIVTNPDLKPDKPAGEIFLEPPFLLEQEAEIVS